jgi:hypothetical protein
VRGKRPEINFVLGNETGMKSGTNSLFAARIPNVSWVVERAKINFSGAFFSKLIIRLN